MSSSLPPKELTLPFYLLPSYVMLRWDSMNALLTLRNVFWAATTLGEVVLIWYLIRGKLVRSHLWLFLYLCCTVLQSVLGVITYSLVDDFRGALTATSSGAVRRW